MRLEKIFDKIYENVEIILSLIHSQFLFCVDAFLVKTNLNCQKRKNNGQKTNKQKQKQKKSYINIYTQFTMLLLFTIYCVIVTTGRFSHDSYTMKPRDILSRTHVCQTMCVLRHPKVSLPIQ